MAVQTKGFCKYCGKEYTKAGILRHLQACNERKNSLSKENVKRRNRWNLVIILCLTVICFFVVKNIRTVSKITFDCIYFTFVKTLFPYENVFVVEKEKIVIKK